MINLTKAKGVAQIQQPPQKNYTQRRTNFFYTSIAQEAIPLQENEVSTQDSLSKTSFTRNRSRKKIYNGKGYLTKHCFVTSSVKKEFDTLLAPYNKDTRKFFIHLYESNLLKYVKTDGWVEMHCLFIKDEFPKMSSKDLEELVSNGLIEVDRSYTIGSKCRNYRINQEEFELIAECTYKDLLAGDTTRFDLITGKQVNSTPLNRMTSTSGVEASELQKAAIESYKNSPNKFHRPSVLNELRAKKQAYEDELNTNGKTKRYYYLRSSYWSSLLCFKSVMIDYKAVGIGDGFYLYTPAYEPQKSGRLTHIKGGFQNCSRTVTAAAFAYSGYTNYDLASSQPTIYNEMLKGYQIDDGGWLQDYIDGVTTKQSIAQEIGVSVEVWKKIICALLMGGTVPKMTLESFKKAKNIKTNNISSIIKYLLEEQTAEQAYNSYCKFLGVCKPLLAAVKEVENRIKLAIKNKDSHLLPELTKYKGKWAILNKTGNFLYINSLNPSDIVAKVAAHLLQGAERALVSNILRLASKYNFRPVADYHDGFLSEGLVPQACVDEAIAACGVFGKLEIKPLELAVKKEVLEKPKGLKATLLHKPRPLRIGVVALNIPFCGELFATERKKKREGKYNVKVKQRLYKIMSLQNVINRFDNLRFTKLEKERERDRQKAIEVYSILLEDFKYHFPTFWTEHEKSPFITGCTLVKQDPNIGGNAHNTPALILEDRFLLYFYRSSAYYKMCISLKRSYIFPYNMYECEFRESSCEEDLHTLLSKAMGV